MSLSCSYATYGVDLTPAPVNQCVDATVDVLAEAGMVVRHDRFRAEVGARAGAHAAADRVRFERGLTRPNLGRIIAFSREQLPPDPPPVPTEWRVECGGSSMHVSARSGAPRVPGARPYLPAGVPPPGRCPE